MPLAAIRRRLIAFIEAIVTDDGSDPEAIVGEDAIPPRRLRGAMLGAVAPCPHRRLIAPEGERQEFVRIGEALETLDRDEAVDPVQQRTQIGGEPEIGIALALGGQD